MEVSKLKLELYDLAAIVLPGILFICELWSLVAGWPSLLNFVQTLKGTELTLLILGGFVSGNLIQEASDKTIKLLCGDRFFKVARDKFWRSIEANAVRRRISEDGGPENASVDTAFNFCLTRISGSFPKRDVFLAISDLARSIGLLSIFAAVPISEAILKVGDRSSQIKIGVIGALAVTAATVLSWSRMVRFRELSETPVFHSYLAQPTTTKPKVEDPENDDDS